ncbi:PD-(D/E)XK nuclease domain-containing protein [Actinosynnema sp. NPDC004786]
MTPVNRADDSEHLPVLGGQLDALRRRVESANSPGSLDGLLARHILRDAADIAWRVDPFSGAWLTDNEHRLEEPGPIAVLGYGLSDRPDERGRVVEKLTSGLDRLRRRNPFPGDRVSFLHNIGILLGVYLAAEAVQSEVPEFRPWLQATLENQRLRPADRLHELTQRHVHASLSGRPNPLGVADILHRDEELAMVSWMVARGTASLSDPLRVARELRKRTLGTALRVDAEGASVLRAALLLRAANDSLDASIDQLVLSHSHVSTVLRRFEAAMRRWRWDRESLQHPIRWEIRSEREVQDILLIMLRSVFDDVVDEDPLPKIGHSSYRVDFGLPSLGVIVEVKYAYKASDFKKIENEVMIDAAAYLKESDRYKDVIVFIYDESSSVEHHDVTRRALAGLPGVTDVIIVSRPGVLPVPTRTPVASERERDPD